MPWYKDRDFPEVKASNSDIIAIIENSKQLERVIKEYNDLEDRLYEALSRANELEKLFLAEQQAAVDMFGKYLDIKEALELIEINTRNNSIPGHPGIECQECRDSNNVANNALEKSNAISKTS